MVSVVVDAVAGEALLGAHGDEANADEQVFEGQEVDLGKDLRLFLHVIRRCRFLLNLSLDSLQALLHRPAYAPCTRA